MTKKIANSFNDYFINVGKSLAHNIVSQIDSLSYIDESKNCITDISVTVNDVKAIVSQQVLMISRHQL